jgi:hypothetical protein
VYFYLKLDEKSRLSCFIIIALAAQATLKHYFPDDSRPDIVVSKVNDWIETSVEFPDDFPDTLFPDINEGGMHQAADEAYNIFYGLLKALNKESAPTALIDILYDAITGDAISPFTAAKRDLFNWWIIEVVPKAYHLKLPSNLYPRASAFISLS